MKKLAKRSVALVLAAFMLFSLASCGKGPIISITFHGNKVEYTPSGKNTKDLLQGISSGDVTVSSIDKKDVVSLYSFYLDLFKNSLAEDKTSSLISPLSIAVVMSMVTDGACGNTLSELESAIGITADELDGLLSSYLRSLYYGENCELHYANSIWISSDERLTVNQRYLQRMADMYLPGVYSVDFADSKTLKDINNWVKANTDGMIKELVDELDPYTSMVLVNALSFDAEWAKKYEKSSVSTGTFTDNNGNKFDTKFMSSSENEYFETDNAVGFSKPYVNGKYKFVALMPNEDVDVFDYISSLDAKTLVKTISNPKKGYSVIAKMPKFSLDYDISLVDALVNMGISDAFSPDNADFTDMASYGENGDNIYLSDVIHKTHIEVTENGTKAAAVTAALMCESSAFVENENIAYVTLNRPFVYMIVDTENNLPLFMGVNTGIVKNNNK